MVSQLFIMLASMVMHIYIYIYDFNDIYLCLHTTAVSSMRILICGILPYILSLSLTNTGTYPKSEGGRFHSCAWLLKFLSLFLCPCCILTEMSEFQKLNGSDSNSDLVGAGHIQYISRFSVNLESSKCNAKIPCQFLYISFAQSLSIVSI